MHRAFVLITAASLGLAWLLSQTASANMLLESASLPVARAVQSSPCDDCPDSGITLGAGCVASCVAATAVAGGTATACPAIVQSCEHPTYVGVIFADRAIAPPDRPPKSAI